MKKQFLLESVVGPLYLVASEKALQGVFWSKQKVEMGESPLLKKASRQLNEFLQGKRKAFTIPVEAEGTEFQKRVWNELSKIPYGETVSYQDIAKRIRKPKAVRAVGTANGRNPLSLVIPCHRVISSNGNLGGYNGGLKNKTFLLNLEKQK